MGRDRRGLTALELSVVVEPLAREQRARVRGDEEEVEYRARVVAGQVLLDPRVVVPDDAARVGLGDGHREEGAEDGGLAEEDEAGECELPHLVLPEGARAEVPRLREADDT